jgi:hypothetical protein
MEREGSSPRSLKLAIGSCIAIVQFTSLHHISVRSVLII